LRRQACRDGRKLTRQIRLNECRTILRRLLARESVRQFSIERVGASAFVILYAYAGYPIVLLFLRVVIDLPRRPQNSIAPNVTLLVPAYKESKLIRASFCPSSAG
jgi:hypothetical protein